MNIGGGGIMMVGGGTIIVGGGRIGWIMVGIG